MSELSVLQEVAWKFGLAVLLSGLVGIERERKGRAAGLRTHVLVCLGSTLAMVMGDYLAGEAAGGTASVTFDRGRIAAGVITGIGFLGAGTIVVVGRTSRGLTTAATIWFVAILGLAIGTGRWLTAISATAFALAMTMGLKAVEYVLPSHDQFYLRIRMAAGTSALERLEEMLTGHGYRVKASRLRWVQGGEHLDVELEMRSRRKVEAENAVELIQAEFPEANSVTFER